jgi:hypothetical protein
MRLDIDCTIYMISGSPVGTGRASVGLVNQYLLQVLLDRMNSLQVRKHNVTSEITIRSGEKFRAAVRNARSVQ